MKTNQRQSELSENVDKSRRTIFRAMLTGAAFIAPLMASFSKDGLNFQGTPAAAARKKAKPPKKGGGGGGGGKKKAK